MGIKEKMGMMGKSKRQSDAIRDDSPVDTPVETKVTDGQKITFSACLLGTVASIGGFMFGYVRYDFAPPPPFKLRMTTHAPKY